MLVGRAAECARIDLLLAEARAGRGGALVVHGEPGIGKTALLAHAADGAEDMRIVRVRGVETETTLPFAGLVDLLTPLTEHLAQLPERQADAVRSALAIGPTRAADRLAVLVGGFNLLCAAAGTRALLVLVDDAQWLDAASVPSRSTPPCATRPATRSRCSSSPGRRTPASSSGTRRSRCV
jgi:predicted ATPase